MAICKFGKNVTYGRMNTPTTIVLLGHKLINDSIYFYHYEPKHKL